MPLPTQEQLDRARSQAGQARARYQALQARFSDANRRLDTRRKIILGGLLLDAAEKDERFARVLATLLQRVGREHDRRVFDGWTPPAPTPGVGGEAHAAAEPGPEAPPPVVAPAPP